MLLSCLLLTPNFYILFNKKRVIFFVSEHMFYKFVTN